MRLPSLGTKDGLTSRPVFKDSNYSTKETTRYMCGGVLTGLSGVIASPGYPEDYSNNADCSWSIHVSNVSVVTLVFWDFQLENNEGCNFDFVAVFDGPTVSHRHLGKYFILLWICVFLLSFCVFMLLIHLSGVILCVFGHIFCVYVVILCIFVCECQRVLSAVSGNFSSPHFPNIYPNNINCHWSIVLADGYRIKLFFPFMEIEDRNSLSNECDYDSVAVYDGESEADTMLGRFCGREHPPSLISKGNKLLVVLRTDRNEAHKGFTASYLGGNCSSMVVMFHL
uniref:CUB domain containing protein 2 n=1 Tax=Gouania willdenowi TaxID=441366 RepID=A0A8C5I3E7_GOUWI